jgi:hypothetical protein
MSQCLKDQTQTHGLDQSTAVSACTKMMQDHLKNTKVTKQQQKTASTNRFKDASWEEIKAAIIA